MKLNLRASVQWSQGGNAVIPILKLEKQSTGWLQLLELQLYIVDISVNNPNAVRGYLTVPDFLEDPAICPVTTLKHYLNKASLLTFWMWKRKTNQPDNNVDRNHFLTFSHRFLPSVVARRGCFCPWLPPTTRSQPRLSPGGYWRCWPWPESTPPDSRPTAPGAPQLLSGVSVASLSVKFARKLTGAPSRASTSPFIVDISTINLAYLLSTPGSSVFSCSQEINIYCGWLSSLLSATLC